MVVADYLCWQAGSMVSDMVFSRPLQDWEMETFTSFMALIYSSKIRRCDED